MDNIFALDLAVEPTTLESKRAELEYLKLSNYYTTVPRLFCKTAMSRKNCFKNRYRNIIPIEKTRVVLKNPKEFGFATDYINANFLEQGKYICTQAPVPASIDSFWAMVWNYHIPCIVMLCKFVENGNIKSHSYWPQKPGQINVQNKFIIRCEKVQNLPGHNLVVTYLTLCYGKQTRKLVHIWYQGWNDFGCPESFRDIELLRAINAIHKHKKAPFLIHCSAGVGRSGTYALIEYCLFHKTKNVFEALLQLRKERAGLVQHVNQYKFAKKYVIYHLS